jgi:hypothetical protein
MKLIKTAALVLLLAATGCKESADKMTMVASAHATPVETSVRHMYSGANISNKAARGQVYEYH